MKWYDVLILFIYVIWFGTFGIRNADKKETAFCIFKIITGVLVILFIVLLHFQK